MTPQLEALLAQIPEPMRSALREQDDEFAEEMALAYCSANDLAKADIMAFFESDGPRMVHESKLKIEDGTPTSDDLRRMSDGEA